MVLTVPLPGRISAVSPLGYQHGTLYVLFCSCMMSPVAVTHETPPQAQLSTLSQAALGTHVAYHWYLMSRITTVSLIIAEGAGAYSAETLHFQNPIEIFLNDPFTAGESAQSSRAEAFAACL